MRFRALAAALLAGMALLAPLCAGATKAKKPKPPAAIAARRAKPANKFKMRKYKPPKSNYRAGKRQIPQRPKATPPKGKRRAA